MTTQLLESDFITMNIQSMINNSTEQHVEDSTESEATQTENSNQKNINWGEELKKRIAANKSMSPEARISDYDIETEFFKEFFSAQCDKASVAPLMLIGDQLRKDIKTLGFKKQTNPIFAFICLSYVQKDLIQTKLLNANTYKAIHNAIAKRWIADSEFFKANDYNIIYCKDLYKKSVKEIQEYLKLQAEGILKPQEPVYTFEMQTTNKKIFIFKAKNSAPNLAARAKSQLATSTRLPSMQNNSTKLNELELAETVLEMLTNTRRTKKREEQEGSADSSTLQKLANKFENDPAKILAFMQYFSVITGSDITKETLNNEKLRRVPVTDLVTATAEIAEFIPQAKLSKKDATALISKLLGDL